MTAPEVAARPARTWRTYLYWLGLAAGAGLFGWQFWRGLAGLGGLMLSAGAWAWLGLAVAAVALANFIQVLAWAHIMGGLGASLPGRLGTVHGYVVSGLARYIPGGVWGLVSRGQWLNQSRGVAFRVSSAGAVLEMAGLTGAAGVLALVYWSQRAAAEASGWPLLLLAVAGAGALWLGPAAVARLGPSAWLVRRGLVPDELRTFRLRRWGQVLIAQGCVWLCLGVALWGVAQALGAGAGVDLGGCAFAFALAYLAGLFFLIAPAGLGMRELALAGLLTSVVGLAGPVASSAAVLMRLASLAAELLWVLMGAAGAWGARAPLR